MGTSNPSTGEAVGSTVTRKQEGRGWGESLLGTPRLKPPIRCLSTVTLLKVRRQLRRMVDRARTKVAGFQLQLTRSGYKSEGEKPFCLQEPRKARQQR